MAHKSDKYNEYHYRNVGGTLCLYCGDKLISFPSGDPDPNDRQLAFCFDSESGVLHKHGALSWVETWMTNARQKFNEGGFPEMAEHLMIVSAPAEGPDAWDAALISRFISTTGYIKHWYSEQAKDRDAIDVDVSPSIM